MVATIIVWTDRRLRVAVEREAARRNLGVSETAEQILKAGLSAKERNAPLRLALSLPDLALALGLDRATVYRKLASGEIDIPTFRIGSSVRVRVVDVEQYLERQVLGSAADRTGATRIASKA